MAATIKSLVFPRRLGEPSDVLLGVCFLGFILQTNTTHSLGLTGPRVPHLGPFYTTQNAASVGRVRARGRTQFMRHSAT